MSYTVDMRMQPIITFGPKTLVEEVGQNIRTLLATPVGSVPYARAIGLDNSILDDPLPILRARLTGAILTLVAEYEPRATITKVDFFQDDQTGTLIPIVYYSLAEEVSDFG